jgi:hypothetical protein
MHDRPTAEELIAAVRLHLERELIPTLTDARLRFQTLVAFNVLAIVERELQQNEEVLREERRWLAELLGTPLPEPQQSQALRQQVRHATEQLCQRIRTGQFDDPPRFAALSKRLREIVKQKLEVANPKYLVPVANA